MKPCHFLEILAVVERQASFDAVDVDAGKEICGGRLSAVADGVLSEDGDGRHSTASADCDS